MATTSLTSKDEFVNTTDGWVGVVELDHLGQAKGGAVEPGGSTFLNEEEQILTANAPRMDADNPFANGALQLKTRSVDIKQRRPYGGGEIIPTPAEREEEETGAPPLPAGEAPEGSSAPGEEVATPEAAKPATMTAKPRRRRS